MAKTTGSHRTTISVPLDLKKRMDKVKEDVNWSALACQAFEGKLAEIAAKKETKTMEDVIQRLRGSLRQHESETYKEGYEFGQEWAQKTAEAGELKRLERAIDQHQRNWEETFEVFEGQSGGVPARGWVYSLIWPADTEFDKEDDFWGAAIGDDLSPVDEPQFVRGFAEGAVDIWRQLKSRV
jgi:hypothetical protein